MAQAIWNLITRTAYFRALCVESERPYVNEVTAWSRVSD